MTEVLFLSPEQFTPKWKRQTGQSNNLQRMWRWIHFLCFRARILCRKRLSERTCSLPRMPSKKKTRQKQWQRRKRNVHRHLRPVWCRNASAFPPYQWSSCLLPWMLDATKRRRISTVSIKKDEGSQILASFCVFAIDIAPISLDPTGNQRSAHKTESRRDKAKTVWQSRWTDPLGTLHELIRKRSWSTKWYTLDNKAVRAAQIIR